MYHFVIDFTEYIPGVATRFIQFCDALETLLGKPVDFIFDRSMKPRTRAFIEVQRETVFEATDGAVAVFHLMYDLDWNLQESGHGRAQTHPY